MIAVAIFPVFYFFLELNLFPVLHCALFSLSADWALLDCVIDRKVRDVIFEAILNSLKRKHLYRNLYLIKMLTTSLERYWQREPDTSVFL